MSTIRGNNRPSSKIRPFFFLAEAGIRARNVTGVQTCALPICCCTDDSVHEELHGYWLSSDRFAVFPDCHANGRESLLSSQLVPLAEEYRIYDRNIVPAGGQVAVDREPVLTESIDSVSSYHHEAVCGFAQDP